MPSIQITPATNIPLEVTYGDRKFMLPTRIPVELIIAQDSVPRPKIMVGDIKDQYEAAVGAAVLAAWLETIVPQEFRDVLGMRDVGQVFLAWAEVSGWGKSMNSDTSGGVTSTSLSTNSTGITYP